MRDATIAGVCCSLICERFLALQHSEVFRLLAAAHLQQHMAQVASTQKGVFIRGEPSLSGPGLVGFLQG